MCGRYALLYLTSHFSSAISYEGSFQIIFDLLVMNKVLEDIVSRLKHQGLNESLNHLQQAKSAFERSEWESANSQIRTFLESLFNNIAAIRVKSNKKGGMARKELEDKGLLQERDARLLQYFMDTAGGKGSHAGVSNEDEVKGRFLAGLGIAYLGLALIPELVHVEDVIVGNLTAPSGKSLPTDREMYTSCPTCKENQHLNEAEIIRDGEDTVYICRNGC
jgi:hypothetical protein